MFIKGKSGNPLGRSVEKPFADALRLEIAAAGEDHAALRKIAKNLLRIAQIKKGVVALPAIMALADRLDGKPAQESVVAVVKRQASDWTREELMEFIRLNSPQMREVVELKPNDEHRKLS